ncbi:MAG: 23S rRNA (uracil(1939)-C(5))-methyltransferase RlmD [Coriobacteriales bacterium]|jgi:23S rRNA (uracil1939-C5)-methyltransferase|nr:23S rRNA (uracil(1939)-C(5))-methyltransferase RlmD [Coriobacteriales bacterium]
MSEYEDIRITALAYTGTGVARLTNGKTVFVEDAVAGDRVRVRIGDDRSNYARATITEMLEPSPERIEPACPHHAVCGGCSLQHLTYREQLRWKRRFVVDALTRIAAIDDAETLVSDIVASGETWGYRNRIEMEAQRQGNRLALGFHAKGNATVVPVEQCLLFPTNLIDLPRRLAGTLNYALRNTDAPLKRVGVRMSRTSGDVELALWTEPGPCNRGFVANVLGDTLKTTSLVRVLTTGPLAKRTVKKVEVLSGRGYWREDIGAFRYRVSAPSFFQVNTPVATLMVDRVMADINPIAGRVLDLYSGVGTFTLPLAERTNDLCAVEAEGSSIRDLRRNLATYGLDAEVLGGGVEYAGAELANAELIVVDPPRSGLSTGVRHLLAKALPPVLIYVSCNPSTLARDVKYFTAQGYHLKSAAPFDLFPQTYHVETVAHLFRH